MLTGLASGFVGFVCAVIMVIKVMSLDGASVSNLANAGSWGFGVDEAMDAFFVGIVQVERKAPCTLLFGEQRGVASRACCFTPGTILF